MQYHPLTITKAMARLEVCIKFVKCNIKKCFDTTADVNVALLQMGSIPTGMGTSNSRNIATEQTN